MRCNAINRAPHDRIKKKKKTQGHWVFLVYIYALVSTVINFFRAYEYNTTEIQNKCFLSSKLVMKIRIVRSTRVFIYVSRKANVRTKFVIALPFNRNALTIRDLCPLLGVGYTQLPIHFTVCLGLNCMTCAGNLDRGCTHGPKCQTRASPEAPLNNTN